MLFTAHTMSMCVRINGMNEYSWRLLLFAFWTLVIHIRHFHSNLEEVHSVLLMV